MNAADSLAALERRALRIHDLKLWALLAAVSLAFAGAYCAGARSHGGAATAIAHLEAKHDTVMDTIRVVERRLVVDTIRQRTTAAAAVAARVAFDSARSELVAMADTAAVLPTSVVLPALHIADVALAKDSLAYVAVVGTLADMTLDRDSQRDRAETAEAEAKILKPPRVGLKTGIAIGATAIAVATHPAVVAKAVVWLIRML